MHFGIETLRCPFARWQAGFSQVRHNPNAASKGEEEMSSRTQRDAALPFGRLWPGIALFLSIVLLLGGCGGGSTDSSAAGSGGGNGGGGGGDYLLVIDGKSLLPGDITTVGSKCSIKTRNDDLPGMTWTGTSPTVGLFDLGISWGTGSLDETDPFTLPDYMAGIDITTPFAYSDRAANSSDYTGGIPGTSVTVHQDGDWYTAEGTLLETAKADEIGGTLHSYKFRTKCENKNWPRIPNDS
jgi:hypothetical protein